MELAAIHLDRHGLIGDGYPARPMLTGLGEQDGPAGMSAQAGHLQTVAQVMNDIQAVGANRSGRAQDNDPAVVHSLEGKKAGRQAAPKGPVRRSTEQRRSFPDGRSGPTIPVGQNRRIVVGLHGISQVVLAWGVGHGRPEARLLQEAGLLPTPHASRSNGRPEARLLQEAGLLPTPHASRSNGRPEARLLQEAGLLPTPHASRSNGRPEARLLQEAGLLPALRAPRFTLHALAGCYNKFRCEKRAKR